MAFDKRYIESDENTRHIWNVERIWKLAEELPLIEIDIEEVVGLDSNTWFDDSNPPTIRAISEHTKRILEADMSYPPILTARGRVFDGMHRIARHLMEGQKKIKVKRFDTDPTPDIIE